MVESLGKLDGTPIQWVPEWKYLGVTLRSGPRFSCSVTERVKSFYRSLNSILRIDGRSEDMVLLQMIETHCIPILTYAIAVTGTRGKKIDSRGRKKKILR